MWAAVVVLAAAGALVLALGGGTAPSRARGTSRVDLERALVATRSTVTADLTLHVHATVDGISISATATGGVDFETKAASLSVHTAGRVITLIASNNVVYVKGLSLLASGVVGKTWVRVPISQFQDPSGDGVFTTADPQAMLATLVRLGATVTPTGASTVGAVQDQGYRIHLSFAALGAHAFELPFPLRALFVTGAAPPKTGQLSAVLYVDPAGQLQAARVSVDAQVTGHRAQASVDLSLSDFGHAAVSPPPPATQTETVNQLSGGVAGALRPTGPSS
jgi:hypothetical protein